MFCYDQSHRRETRAKHKLITDGKRGDWKRVRNETENKGSKASDGPKLQHHTGVVSIANIAVSELQDTLVREYRSEANWFTFNFD